MTTPTVRTSVPGPPPLGTRLAQSWTHAYTRRLRPETAAARRDEIAADLHDHLAAARTAGQPDSVTARAIAARMLLGVPADLSWRHHHLGVKRRAERKENVMSQPATSQPSTNRGAHFSAALAGALVVGWIVFIGVGSTMYAIDNDSSVNWGAGAFVVILVAVGVLGLVRLARDTSSGPFLLAAAAFGSTIPFFWAPLIPLVGLAFAAGFIAYGMSVKANSDAGSLEPSQT